jgi:hypothetical protein
MYKIDSQQYYFTNIKSNAMVVYRSKSVYIGIWKKMNMGDEGHVGRLLPYPTYTANLPSINIPSSLPPQSSARTRS